jgi:hypothetical protein
LEAGFETQRPAARWPTAFLLALSISSGVINTTTFAATPPV